MRARLCTRHDENVFHHRMGGKDVPRRGEEDRSKVSDRFAHDEPLAGMAAEQGGVPGGCVIEHQAAAGHHRAAGGVFPGTWVLNQEHRGLGVGHSVGTGHQV